MEANPQATTEAASLVFPAGMAGALAFTRERAASRRVIGASSLPFDPARTHYREWLRLPYVTEAGFEPALARAIAAHGIDEVFTPHAVVGAYLARRLAEIAPGVRLSHGGPEAAVAAWRAGMAETDALRAAVWELAGPPPARPPLGAAQARGLCHVASLLPGHCGDEKIWALVEVARRCPVGDLVEIASAWGKSAFVLAWLARRYGIGRLLCVDPWSAAERHQHDRGGPVNGWAERMDFEAAHAIFEANLALFGGGWVNALRATSVEAAAIYAAGEEVCTSAFGRTRYRGRIALVHIDGNHDFDHVSEDDALWSRHLVPGGWLVLDDYRWAFGDGPRRAGERFLEAHGGALATAFVAGSALFVRLV